MTTTTAWQTLRDYAEGRIDHAWNERCPNDNYGHDIRDSSCPVCQALDAVQGCLAQIEELAGAAPAAVSPQGVYPTLPKAAIWSTADQDGMPKLGKGWMFSPVQQGNATLPLFTARQMWAYHDLGRQPAPAAPALEAPAAPAVPPGFALVPLRLTRAMDEVLEEEGWQWEDLLAAAEAVSEEQYESITHDRLSRDEVRAIFLDAGFTIKEGQTDLKPYVYEAAQELEYRVRQALAAAPQAPAAPAVDATPLDGCTDPYNCARCKAHPNHRKGLEHAGISSPKKGGRDE